MKTLLLSVFLLTGCSALPETTYLKVGTGYKVHETKLTHFPKGGKAYNMNDPITARFELGMECVWKNVTCGVTHHSQWFSGTPFNDKEEYGKTEFFIEYKFELGKR